jgi:RNA:NAD 2'-phosphotransferase (TPT1/KptA family)
MYNLLLTTTIMVHASITDGYVDVEEILELREASNKTKDDVRRIVRNDGKGRFTLREVTGQNLQIKATQGHSFKVSKNTTF